MKSSQVVGNLWEQMCLLTKQMDELRHEEPQMKPYLAEAVKNLEKALSLTLEAKHRIEQGEWNGNDESER